MAFDLDDEELRATKKMYQTKRDKAIVKLINKKELSDYKALQDEER